MSSFLDHDQTRFLIVTPQERAVLSRAVEVHTVIHVTQIWAGRLKLTSIYVSRLSYD